MLGLALRMYSKVQHRYIHVQTYTHADVKTKRTSQEAEVLHLHPEGKKSSSELLPFHLARRPRSLRGIKDHCETSGPLETCDL